MEDIRNLDDWLDNNVLKVVQPKVIRLHNFTFDWGKLKGVFRLEIDGLSLDCDFQLYLNIDGFIHFRAPVIHSPLGVPASYSIVEFDSVSEKAILEELKRFFPTFRAYGYHKDIGKMISAMSDDEERIINSIDISLCQEKLSKKDFSLTILI
jgi:hypothetical protein